MKKSLVVLLVFGLGLPSAFPAAFTPGNLVIYRVGTGAAALSNASTAIFLDEYTTAGALVQSVAVATTGANQLTAAGTSTAEGFLSLSPNGQYLSITGYDATTGISAISATASTTTQRAAEIYDLSGTVLSKSTFGTLAFSGNSIRSAVTVDGTNIYAAGNASSAANSGIWYHSGASNTSIVTGNLREVEIFNNQLYVSTGAAGTTRVAAVGSGLPTTTVGAGNIGALTVLTGLPTTGNASQFLFFDLDATVSGLDTLYYANDTGLAKYSLVSGTWTSNGTITNGAMSGLTGFLDGANISLFGTTTTAAGTLSSFTDTTGYNGSLGGAFGTLATAGTNTAFRGIVYLPVVAVPEPGEYAVAVAGLLGALIFLRRRGMVRG